MKIGIDISQLAYEGTGVANYLGELVENLIKNDTQNDYVLFFSSMRRKPQRKWEIMRNKRVRIKAYRYPPKFLDLLWNRLHICPIEWFVGAIDVYITSDWTEPPTLKAKKISILYDLIVYKHPKE